MISQLYRCSSGHLTFVSCHSDLWNLIALKWNLMFHCCSSRSDKVTRPFTADNLYVGVMISHVISFELRKGKVLSSFSSRHFKCLRAFGTRFSKPDRMIMIFFRSSPARNHQQSTTDVVVRNKQRLIAFVPKETTNTMIHLWGYMRCS